MLSSFSKLSNLLERRYVKFTSQKSSDLPRARSVQGRVAQIDGIHQDQGQKKQILSCMRGIERTYVWLWCAVAGQNDDTWKYKCAQNIINFPPEPDSALVYPGFKAGAWDKMLRLVAQVLLQFERVQQVPPLICWCQLQHGSAGLTMYESQNPGHHQQNYKCWPWSQEQFHRIRRKQALYLNSWFSLAWPQMTIWMSTAFI